MELFSEMLTPTQSEWGSSEEIGEVEIEKKDRSCLTKMMTPPLAYGSSRERMPDRE